MKESVEEWCSQLPLLFEFNVELLKKEEIDLIELAQEYYGFFDFGKTRVINIVSIMACLRHQYTNYDQLLKSMPSSECYPILKKYTHTMISKQMGMPNCCCSYELDSRIDLECSIDELWESGKAYRTLRKNPFLSK